MSSDLRDFRGKITALTWAFLESESVATGEEFSSIVRQVMHGWALRKLEAHTVATRILSDEGLVAESEGNSANRRTSPDACPIAQTRYERSR